MTLRGETVLMVSVMRNEGPYILEWLAHHFALGIDELLIFTNFCTDNTDLILDRLETLMPGRVKHQPNPKVMFPDRGKWHIMALRYAGHFGRYKAADWVYVTDADEFLILRNGAKTLEDFFDATGPADAVSFTSVPFGSDGLKQADPSPVTARFTTAARDFDAEAAAGGAARTAVKTLFRNALPGARRPHRPVTPDFSAQGKIWINGSGQPFEANWTDSGDKSVSGHGTRDYAQVNHYSIKSAAEFLLKVDRGDAVNANRLGSSLSYWQNADKRAITDRSGSKMTSAAKAIYDDFLSDPELRRLHERSFELRQTRLTEILATRDGQDLARAIGYFG